MSSISNDNIESFKESKDSALARILNRGGFPLNFGDMVDGVRNKELSRSTSSSFGLGDIPKNDG